MQNIALRLTAIAFVMWAVGIVCSIGWLIVVFVCGTCWAEDMLASIAAVCLLGSMVIVVLFSVLGGLLSR